MGNFIRHFKDYLETERQYAKDTVVAYVRDVESFQESLVSEGIALEGVSYDQVRLWIVYLSESGLGNRSINRKISSLKAFYSFLHKIGQVDVNPLQKHRSLKVDKKLQLPFSKDEMDRVRDLLDQQSGFEAKRDKLIVEMLYFLGLRRSELVGLVCEDLDFYSGTVLIRGKGGKERLMPLLPELRDLIGEYMECRRLQMGLESKGNLFLLKDGNKIDDSFVYRMINNYFSKVTSKEKKSPHVLRHTFATHLLNNGADINSIKELMGHSSLSSTEIYTHANLAELKKVYETSHPRMKKK